MELKTTGFLLDKTLLAGQTFGWSKVNGSWCSFFKKPILLKQKPSGEIEFSGASEMEVKQMLGLDDDIEGIKAEIDKDDFIDRAISYSYGLRVVKDGLWPSTLSFILSIQSNIPLITKRIKTLSELYGSRSSASGIELNSFPSYQSIHDGGKDKLERVKLGFRSRFVLSAADYFYSHEISEDMSVDELRESLSNILGVGDKVLDCIMLYGLHDLSAFPMDVWILRALSNNYPHLLKGLKSYKSKRKAMSDYFGRYAGYAQLFIYDYVRHL